MNGIRVSGLKALSWFCLAINTTKLFVRECGKSADTHFELYYITPTINFPVHDRVLVIYHK